MPSYQCWEHSLRSLLTIMHQLQRCRGLYFFQMSQDWVCIRSVFKPKICPYKVCIFFNMGPSGKVAALHCFLVISKTGKFLGYSKTENFMKLLETFKQSFTGVLCVIHRGV